MRIRKGLPLPLSSLPPVPLSDPHLISRSPVVVQLNDATPSTPKSSSTALSSASEASRSDRPQPSDQPLSQIGKTSDGWDDPSGGVGNVTESGVHSWRRKHRQQDRLEEEEEGKGQGGGEKGNDSRKGATFGSETPSLSSPSCNQGRWCAAGKAIPLKKRRGTSFENETTMKNNSNDNHLSNKKMNKCTSDNMEPEDVDEVEETKPNFSAIISKKKRGRGNAVMEGSRCSRMNGRGWRCSQQTLVGYSLCEHHLGKGRLRSMTSVRSRSLIIATIPKNVHRPLSVASLCSSSDNQAKCITDDTEPPMLGSNDDENKKPSLITTKKRMKLGMVKARSISSLLAQTKPPKLQ